MFGLLDDPADMARSELLATYDEIGLEISRREVGREPEPVSALDGPAAPPASRRSRPTRSRGIQPPVPFLIRPPPVATVEMCR